MADDDRKAKPGLSYADAGVDIDAQDEALRRIKSVVGSTRTAGVLADLGSFGGLFVPDLSGLAEPVLVASADGVGTKLKIAFETGTHDTVGRCLVHHCVNDILVQGARPLFFMDYIATGRLDPAVLASVVDGLAAGCREAGCALLGGETAEMPGFYGDGEYDVAGFVVGLVDRPRVVDGSAVRPGDRLIGLGSTGLHTNGYSLARKIFFEVAGLGIDDRVEVLGCSVGEELLKVHRLYLGSLRPLVDAGRVTALSHITGGGLPDNLPRILPEGTAAEVRRGSWPVLPVFDWLQQTGGVAQAEMDRTFNMGIGMVAVVREGDATAVAGELADAGEQVFEIGQVVAGRREVRYVD